MRMTRSNIYTWNLREILDHLRYRAVCLVLWPRLFQNTNTLSALGKCRVEEVKTLHVYLGCYNTNLWKRMVLDNCHSNYEGKNPIRLNRVFFKAPRMNKCKKKSYIVSINNSRRTFKCWCSYLPLEDVAGMFRQFVNKARLRFKGNTSRIKSQQDLGNIG